MSSAFASRCLQGKFLQLICEALNKRVGTGARLPFWRFLVFPHLRGDWGSSAGERHWGPRAVCESQEAGITQIALLPETRPGLVLLARKSKNSSAPTSEGPSDNAPLQLQPASRLPSLQYLLYFLPPQGFGILLPARLFPLHLRKERLSPPLSALSCVFLSWLYEVRFAPYWVSWPPLLCLTCNLIFVGVIMWWMSSSLWKCEVLEGRDLVCLSSPVYLSGRVPLGSWAWWHSGASNHLCGRRGLLALY